MERTEGDAWKELDQQQEFSIESIAVESLVDDWERLRYEDSSWDDPGDLQIEEDGDLRIEEDGDLRIEEDGDLPAGGACDLPVPGACDLPTISAITTLLGKTAYSFPLMAQVLAPADRVSTSLVRWASHTCSL
ncbi:hypothetical protein PF011_g18843 [Phytophthora fragariae]|uniref:Uncharacterized protein n=1 Tax=Phytophthora fragariae TaxID=53985 RepID=A0A6A3J669_9STRA|nr:hypothetical protein PF011_g18843 [Phytophthora fragariae]